MDFLSLEKIVLWSTGSNLSATVFYSMSFGKFAWVFAVSDPQYFESCVWMLSMPSCFPIVSVGIAFFTPSCATIACSSSLYSSVVFIFKLVQGATDSYKVHHNIFFTFSSQLMFRFGE